MPSANLTMITPVEHCRSCGRPIVWAETAAGKRIPLDPEPSERGNVTASLHTGVLHAGVVRGPHRDGLHAAHKPLYLSHFTTCPHADTWRTRR